MSLLKPIWSDYQKFQVGSSYVSYEVGLPSGSIKGTVVGMPGMGDFRQQFRFIAPLFIKDGYRFIAIDLRGTGDSSTDFTSYAFADIVSDVIGIMDKEKVKSVIFLGNSMSACLGVTLAAKHPDRVQALVGLSGFYRVMPAETFFKPLSHLLFTSFYGASVWLPYFKSLFKTLPADFDDYFERMKNHMNQSTPTSRAVILGYYARISKADAWEDARQVSCPTLLLLGKFDPDFKDTAVENETVRERFANNGKGGRVQATLVDGAGHYPHVEAPQVVYDLITSFLKP